MPTKKQFIANLLVSLIPFAALVVFIGYNQCKTPPKRVIIYPEEWSEVKTNDSLIVIYADSNKIELGFNNAKNR